MNIFFKTNSFVKPAVDYIYSTHTGSNLDKYILLTTVTNLSVLSPLERLKAKTNTTIRKQESILANEQLR